MADNKKTNKPIIRYTKPKILIVDLPSSLEKRLRADGYNVRAGTLGRPYTLVNADEFIPIVAKPAVPNYEEQEIVVIDLAPPETDEGWNNADVISPGQKSYFTKPNRGVIDPRPLVMANLQNRSDRILMSGGVFILFADVRNIQCLVPGTFGKHAVDLHRNREVFVDNWSILTILSANHLQVEPDLGNEITMTGKMDMFSPFLRRHLHQATFRAILQPLYPLRSNSKGPSFYPLASNKFGQTVAGVIKSKHQSEGLVLILPQLEDKESALLNLIQTVLPEFLPQLFPHHEGSRWVQRNDYEHPSVLKRKNKQLLIKRKAKKLVSQLDVAIDAEREHWDFLHVILTKSGQSLVSDVKRALEFIGFAQVVDVDEADDDTNKQEDLQILDKSPSLLLEVKGLAGMPTEGDTLQIAKYVLRRIRQWDRTDVIGLSIVNHQRNLPALDRDHAHVFTEHQIQDADQNSTGLMTTWDLFRLIRGMVQWKWTHETVKALFFDKGRVRPIPSHYTLVGEVKHYGTKDEVVSINLNNETLSVGDRVGYLFADGFFEEIVTSLQVNKKDVREIRPPQLAGMKTTLKRSEIPVGTQVYRVGTAAIVGTRK